MPILNHQAVVDRVIRFQASIRDALIQSRRSPVLHKVSRESSADVIYGIDTVAERVLIEACEEWGRETPLVLIAEGLEDEQGREVDERVFPAGASEGSAEIRVIVDPIDGTRGLMYDKRSAWALTGVAPNRGPTTRLRDIEVAVMTELPTQKMGSADVLWAIKGQGAVGRRVNLATAERVNLPLRPSQAESIEHGFAMVCNFLPGTKVLAAELMEFIADRLLKSAEGTQAPVFDDQYISTGGQFYEMIVGHDRFNADLRPLFYTLQGRAAGLCCHPYDCAAMLIAEEAGVILADGASAPLDGPLDVTSPVSWAAYANRSLQTSIEPLLDQFFQRCREAMSLGSSNNTGPGVDVHGKQ